MFNLNYAVSSGFVQHSTIVINLITLQLNEMTHWLYIQEKSTANAYIDTYPQKCNRTQQSRRQKKLDEKQ